MSTQVKVVYLVGAGPGDPDLITLKAIQCLQQADVIFYDALVNTELLRYARPHCRKIYVGKRSKPNESSRHSLDQAELIRRVIHESRRGGTVVRLKGGDPFLFGRGGEEGEALARAGVPFEVVPGITSAMAVPAYAGIPLTHRDYASSVLFLTGHEKREAHGVLPPFDWSVLARVDTLCILMGVQNLPEIVASLQQAGKNPETPVAVIEWGTLPWQRTVEGTLETIAGKVKEADLRSPAVIVLGAVVTLRSKMKWFERQKLFGRRILVTRAREQSGELTRQLRAAGADVIEIPTIEFKPPKSWRPLDQSIKNLSKYEVVIFTSVNAVQSFVTRLLHHKKDLRSLAGRQIVAIGPATAQSLRENGIVVDAMPENYQSEGLVKLFRKNSIRGKKVLLPRAQKGRELLPTVLKKLGARVDVVAAYQTVVPQEGARSLRELLRKKKVDLITFASSSTVENFLKMVGRPAVGRVLKKIQIACIGPVTAKTARRLGLKVTIQPKKATIPELAKAIVKQLH